MANIYFFNKGINITSREKLTPRLKEKGTV